MKDNSIVIIENFNNKNNIYINASSKMSRAGNNIY